MKNQATQSKGPQFFAYHVVKQGKQSRWIRLGAYFPHEDGQGGNLLLDVMPVANFDGRIVLRAPLENAADA